MGIRHMTAGGMAVLFFALVLLVPFAYAAERKVTLSPGPAAEGASGEAILDDKGVTQTGIVITARGLKPNGVYTVWLANEKPKAARTSAGPRYVFRSDEKGNGLYTGTIARAELKKWQLLEVAHHPDGDPANMKNIGIALKAVLKK